MKYLVVILVTMFCSIASAEARDVIEYKDRNYSIDTPAFNTALAKNNITARDIEVIQVTGRAGALLADY